MTNTIDITEPTRCARTTKERDQVAQYLGVMTTVSTGPDCMYPCTPTVSESCTSSTSSSTRAASDSLSATQEKTLLTSLEWSTSSSTSNILRGRCKQGYCHGKAIRNGDLLCRTSSPRGVKQLSREIAHSSRVLKMPQGADGYTMDSSQRRSRQSNQPVRGIHHYNVRGSSREENGRGRYVDQEDKAARHRVYEKDHGDRPCAGHEGTYPGANCDQIKKHFCHGVSSSVSIDPCFMTLGEVSRKFKGKRLAIVQVWDPETAAAVRAARAEDIFRGRRLPRVMKRPMSSVQVEEKKRGTRRLRRPSPAPATRRSAAERRGGGGRIASTIKYEKKDPIGVCMK